MKHKIFGVVDVLSNKVMLLANNGNNNIMPYNGSGRNEDDDNGLVR